MPKPSRSVPQHVLFKFCRDAVGKASLAHTLAECLFWLQHSTKEIDGKPAIWKTGPELADTLGIAPKTANGHLKRLATLGFWQLRYLPRPYHPSPVSWLVFSPKALEILEVARAALVSKSSTKACKEGAVDPAEKDPSGQPNTEVQSTQNGVLKQNSAQSIQKPPSKGDFIPEANCLLNETNELPHKSQKGAGEEKAPAYLKTPPAVEALVNSIQEQLAARNLPEWDTSSQYTWKHATVLWGKLSKAGTTDLADQAQFVSSLLDQWPKVREQMGWRYLSFAGNDARPTPLALAHEFLVFKNAVFPPPPDPIVAHGGGWDFDLGI